MARLTRNEVRLRAAVLVILVCVTFAVVILAFAFALSTPWLWPLVVFVDGPILIVVAILERTGRSSS